jgi:hypothetical protein
VRDTTGVRLVWLRFVTDIPAGYRDWRLVSVAHEEGNFRQRLSDPDLPRLAVAFVMALMISGYWIVMTLAG